MEALSPADAAAQAAAEIAQFFECPVCFQVPRSKKHLRFCFRGHFVCKTCVDLWKGENRSCPVCRTQPFVEMEQNILLENIFGLVLKSHQFKCGQNLAGCPVTGSAQQMDRHEPQCMFHQFKCPNKNCAKFKTLLELTRPNACFEQLPVTGQDRINIAVPFTEFLQEPCGILPAFNRVFMFHYFGLQLPGYILLHVNADKRLCAEARLMGKKTKGSDDKLFYNLALSAYCQGYGTVSGLVKANFKNTEPEDREQVQISQQLLSEWWHRQEFMGSNGLCPMKEPHIHLLIECSVPVRRRQPSTQPIQRWL